MTDKKLSLQSSIAWNSIGSIFYLGCQWLMTVLVVWIAGLETAGILSLAMSVSLARISFTDCLILFLALDVTTKFSQSSRGV